MQGYEGCDVYEGCEVYERYKEYEGTTHMKGMRVGMKGMRDMRSVTRCKMQGVHEF